ncbi:hypothetical protein BDZ89DRAFT_568841 [Hymenopellis radicata]|nr:hypothetical protein BDZ89DRAFT_568841 [Hymenopellis radicata]
MVARGERDGRAGRERWSCGERERWSRGERDMTWLVGERYGLSERDMGCRREIWVVGERLWVVGERYGLSERDDLWSRAERDMTLVAQRDMTLVAPDRYDVGCAGRDDCSRILNLSREMIDDGRGRQGVTLLRRMPVPVNCGPRVTKA